MSEITDEELELAYRAFAKFVRENPQKLDRKLTFAGKTLTYMDILREMVKRTPEGKEYAKFLIQVGFDIGKLERKSSIIDSLADAFEKVDDRFGIVIPTIPPRHYHPRQIAYILRKRKPGYEQLVMSYLSNAYALGGL